MVHDEDSTTLSQYAPALGEHSRRIGRDGEHVAEHDIIEARVGKLQVLSVHDPGGNLRCMAPAARDHAAGAIDPRDLMPAIKPQMRAWPDSDIKEPPRRFGINAPNQSASSRPEKTIHHRI